MKHDIIVKWKNREEMKPHYDRIREIFLPVLGIEGISDVRLIPSCSDRANRYDLIIEITMDSGALPAYDASDAHHEWKSVYGGMIESKAIFDYEE